MGPVAVAAGPELRPGGGGPRSASYASASSPGTAPTGARDCASRFELGGAQSRLPPHLDRLPALEVDREPGAHGPMPDHRDADARGIELRYPRPRQPLPGRRVQRRLVVDEALPGQQAVV